MTMSITRALAELKLIQNRVTKIINQSVFITLSNVQISESDVRADWNSVNDLIARYEKIKFAIIQSNAVTKVTIGSKTYTVAEAIAMKDCIQLKQQLLNKLKQDRVKALSDSAYYQRDIQQKLDNLLQIHFKERQSSDTDMKVIKEAYLKNNEIKLVDPIKLDTRISQFETEFDEFSSNVNFALSESNAITQITV